MDGITEQLVTYVSELSESSLTESSKDAALRHLVDSIACAIAGTDSEAGRLATKVAKSVPMSNGATIIGDGTKVMPEMAAFANTSMIRAWDWNDGLYARLGGHASDMMSAFLAVGEAINANPQEVITSIVIAYEVLGALGDWPPVGTTLGTSRSPTIGRDGWEQGVFLCPAAALGLGKMLGLTTDQLAVATSLSILPGPQLGQSRGHTMWKASATGESMRRSIFAVTLAKAGFTCSLDAFEGVGGIWDKVTGPFKISLPAKPGGRFVVEMSYLKRYPAELHILAVVDLVPRILNWTSVEEIESIVIETYFQAYSVLSLQPTNYDPKFHEQADHSLPFVTAAALTDGKLTRDSYRQERVLDPALRPLMAKIIIRENKEYTKSYRPPGREISGEPNFRVTVTKISGEQYVEEIQYAKGHSSNPMLRKDIDEKLDEACERLVSDERKEAIRTAWWNLNEASSIAEPIKTLASFR